EPTYRFWRQSSSRRGAGVDQILHCSATCLCCHLFGSDRYHRRQLENGVFNVEVLPLDRRLWYFVRRVRDRFLQVLDAKTALGMVVRRVNGGLHSCCADGSIAEMTAPLMPSFAADESKDDDKGSEEGNEDDDEGK